MHELKCENVSAEPAIRLSFLFSAKREQRALVCGLQLAFSLFVPPLLSSAVRAAEKKERLIGD